MDSTVSTWWWGVLARYAGVRAVAFWVGALIAMSIYVAECPCCSGSICACALMLFWWFTGARSTVIYSKGSVFGCVHCGLVVGALVRNPEVSGSSPHHGGLLHLAFKQCLRASSWRFS